MTLFGYDMPRFGGAVFIHYTTVVSLIEPCARRNPSAVNVHLRLVKVFSQ